MHVHTCAALERLGKGGWRCCAGQREGESSFGTDFGTVDENLIARLFMHLPSFPTRSPTVLPVVVLVSLQQVCIQSLFLMSASAPWGDSTLWSLMADNALEISNVLTLEMIPT